MKDELITVETAKLAFKKGFHEDSSNYAIVYDKTQNKELTLLYISTEPIHKNFILIALVCTQSLLQKWLREKHGIHIYIEHYVDKDNYDNYVSNFNHDKKSYSSYEEALETDLKNGLNLIKK